MGTREMTRMTRFINVVLFIASLVALVIISLEFVPYGNELVSVTSITESEEQNARGPHRCMNPCYRTAVVFVHGVTGNASTWAAKDRPSWPAMMTRDAGLKNKIDVYRVDYSSRSFVAPSVIDVSRQFDRELDEILFDSNAYQNIMFVCHSLGGILCHHYKLHLKLKYGHVYAAVVRSIITLGTPYDGSWLANIAAHISSRSGRFKSSRIKCRSGWASITRMA